MTAQPPPAHPPVGVQVGPAPLSYAWGDWSSPADAQGRRELLGAILRLDTLYGRIYGFFEAPHLGGFLASGRAQLLRLPGGDQVAAGIFTSGLLVTDRMPPDPHNGQAR